MVDVPPSLATEAFDGVIRRGNIIHFKWSYRDDNGQPLEKFKFGVILNASLPDDPLFVALATSKVRAYATAIHDANIIRIAVGTYPFLKKDTVLNFRKLEKLDLGDARSQYAARELKIVGQMLRVHVDHADKIIANSFLIEGWKLKRCTPTAPAPAAPGADIEDA